MECEAKEEDVVGAPVGCHAASASLPKADGISRIRPTFLMQIKPEDIVFEEQRV